LNSEAVFIIIGALAGGLLCFGGGFYVLKKRQQIKRYQDLDRDDPPSVRLGYAETVAKEKKKKLKTTLLTTGPASENVQMVAQPVSEPVPAIPISGSYMNGYGQPPTYGQPSYNQQNYDQSYGQQSVYGQPNSSYYPSYGQPVQAGLHSPPLFSTATIPQGQSTGLTLGQPPVSGSAIAVAAPTSNIPDAKQPGIQTADLLADMHRVSAAQRNTEDAAKARHDEMIRARREVKAAEANLNRLRGTGSLTSRLNALPSPNASALSSLTPLATSTAHEALFSQMQVTAENFRDNTEADASYQRQLVAAIKAKKQSEERLRNLQALREQADNF
jgi:hypothetical protein